MALAFRLAEARDRAVLEPMILESFEPITWAKKLDARFGPLNGQDWRARWMARLENVFAGQIILVGEADGEAAACVTGTYDAATRLGYIDILAVARRYQGRGYGRAMLRGMLAHFRELGAEHANLECLADNEVGNNLYRSEGFQEVARHVRWFLKLS